MDLLLRGATVVTMDPARRVLPGADVLVRGSRIVAVGKGAAEKARRPMRVVACEGRVLLPGFVQAHVHLCQTLFRNHADGLQLLEWLRERIWPFEASHTPQTLRLSAELGMAELLKGGTTTILDMATVRHTDVIFEAAKEAGFRLVCGKAHMDAGQGLPAGLRETTKASIEEGEQLCRRWHGQEDGRLRYAFAPRFALSCTEELLREVPRLARQLGARLHTHASENPEECAAVRERFGGENVEVLAGFGYAGDDVALAHCVWLSAREQRLLREAGTHVVHCPSSNCKLASGIAKIPELLEAGVKVALGADGAPCNNNLDQLFEMRLASLIHKPRCGPTAMSAMQVLELATIGGARAVGLGEEIGSIEVGKRADLTLFRLDRVHVTPRGPDPVATIVHSAQRSDVEAVWVDGRQLVRDFALTTLDEHRIVAEAEVAATALARKVL